MCEIKVCSCKCEMKKNSSDNKGSRLGASDNVFSSQQSQEVTEEDKQLQIYRKKLLTVVIGSFIIIFLVIFERIFLDQIFQGEADAIASLQQSWKLVSYKSPKDDYVTFIHNGFLKFIGTLDVFEYSFLLQTHFFVSFYVGIHAVITMKVMYLTMIGQYLIGIIQLAYSGPRPYWATAEASSPVCLQAFTHPSRGVYIYFFTLFYSIFCFRTIKNTFSRMKPKTYQKILLLIQICMTSLGLLYFFVMYIIGEMFLCSFCVALVICFVMYFIFQMLDSSIEDLIKKSTTQSNEAKKYVFYWFFWIILALALNLLVFSGRKTYLNVDWIQNYIYCKKGKNQIPTTDPYDEMIGAWFSIQNSTVMYPLIAALFGVSHCFRKTEQKQWFKGTKKQRLMRALIVNLLMIPSWILVVFQKELVQTDVMRLAGLNDYLLNAIHFFILYFWLFSFVPLYLFKRLQLNHASARTRSTYIVAQDKPELQGQPQATQRSTQQANQPNTQQTNQPSSQPNTQQTNTQQTNQPSGQPQGGEAGAPADQEKEDD